MFNLFDNFMIRVGFDAGDLEQVRQRKLLYGGNMAMLALCLLSFGLLVF